MGGGKRGDYLRIIGDSAGNGAPDKGQRTVGTPRVTAARLPSAINAAAGDDVVEDATIPAGLVGRPRRRQGPHLAIRPRHIRARVAAANPHGRKGGGLECKLGYEVGLALVKRIDDGVHM
jgi:hypothetical protein